MKQMSVSERGAKLETAIILTPRTNYTLNVTLVYSDEASRAWAREVYEKIARSAGRDSIRATWWKVDDLSQPGVLAGAVSTAMRADMIVAALDTAQPVPLPFNIWVNTWLPNRLHSAGCFVALIGKPEKSHAAAKKTAAYLRTVAQHGGFEFIVEERVQQAPWVAVAPEQPWKHNGNGVHPKTNGHRSKLGRETPARKNAFAPAIFAF